MDRSDSTPGFAIVQRRRAHSAISARHLAVTDAEPREAFVSANTDAQGAVNTLAAVADGLTKLEAEIDRSTATLDPIAAEKLRADLAHLGADVIEARAAGGTRAETVRYLRDNVAWLEAELAEARRMREVDLGHVRRLEVQVDELTHDLVCARRQNCADASQIQQLEQALASLNAELSEAEWTLSKVVREDLAVLRRQSTQLASLVGGLRRELDDERARNALLNAENQTLRTQLADSDAMLRAAQAQLQLTRAQLEASQRELAEMAEERAMEAEENALMETWLNSALDRYATLQAEVSALEAQLFVPTERVA